MNDEPTFILPVLSWLTPFATLSSVFSPLPLCPPFLTLQESLFSSWTKSAIGHRCQFQGHRMGAVIIIALPPTCQYTRQQNKRDLLEFSIKSLGLWSQSKRGVGGWGQTVYKINEECPKESRGEWEWQPSGWRPQRGAMFMTGIQVFDLDGTKSCGHVVATAVLPPPPHRAGRTENVTLTILKWICTWAAAEEGIIKAHFEGLN